MNKAQWLKITNLALLVTFILQIISGLIMLFELQVLNLNLMFQAHKYNGLALVGLWGAHVGLNWGWIKTNFFKKNDKTDSAKRNKSA